ncbi:MAG: dTMP kinase [Armatimonadota bacterium]|nr:dTMP kinase [Armatimonadota bacterium]MCX7778382.1 dTMP kinase [Armatimonadota bacterium]MDW8026544.1 dTMP kinase [Armatimonadota bacterium]
MGGLFITFEGIEGSGKSTQARMLAEWLRANGYDVVLTKEPGGTELGEYVRQLLLSLQHHRMSERCELMLFLADRAQHVSELILPALHDGKVVICERFTDSTVAYQHYGLGLSLELIEELNNFVTHSLKPHITFLLDIEPSEGLKRLQHIKSSLDRIEMRSLEFHKKVRTGYLEIAKREPERFIVVNASLPPLELAKQIQERVSDILNKLDLARKH